jgi:glyoxylase-like metal-dependent hydrolase (beta-lactamase superfamily II)
MEIDKLVLGLYENNSYVVRRDNKTSNCIIIDTGLSIEPLEDFLKEKNLNPLALILTHGHADHIAGVPLLRKTFNNIKVCIHKADSNMLGNAVSNLSSLAGAKITTFPADVLFDKEEEIEYAGVRFRLIHTPGHTPGGICLYNRDDKILFSGDTLFAGSTGRTDFPGYDSQKCFEQLVDNIKSKLLVLPDDTIVLPGHGESTAIGQEKLRNPYLH